MNVFTAVTYVYVIYVHILIINSISIPMGLLEKAVSNGFNDDDDDERW